MNKNSCLKRIKITIAYQGPCSKLFNAIVWTLLKTRLKAGNTIFINF